MSRASESPLQRLSTGRGREAPFLEAAETQAGERLARDFERGGLQPSITQSWNAARIGGERGGVGDLSDMAIDARQRVAKAMTAVGPELSGLLLDACCFAKGLETIETERRWPARSAKLLLKTGLAILARHYGLSSAAEGQASSGRIRHWGSGDHRPRARPG